MEYIYEEWGKGHCIIHLSTLLFQDSHLSIFALYLSGDFEKARGRLVVGQSLNLCHLSTALPASVILGRGVHI